MRAREGDMVEARGAFFDVKGLVHPPGKLVASLHFLRAPRGDRRKNRTRYRKIFSLSERQQREKNFPGYLVFDPVLGERLCEVPMRDVNRIYRPIDRLRELRAGVGRDKVERQALSLVEVLKESSNVPWRSFGISGSILVKLHLPTSDIDPIVYGSRNCRRVYAALKSQIESGQGPVKPYGIDGLKRLHEFRSRDTIMSFEDFVRAEPRKVLQGKFGGRDYSIKLVKDWGEVTEKYGSVRYSSVGYAKIRAKVADDSEAIFTPCRYRIESAKVIEGTNVGPIEEIVSFRMRFCEQAGCGEEVIAVGKVERVLGERRREKYRLVVGGKATDFMVRAPTDNFFYHINRQNQGV